MSKSEIMVEMPKLRLLKNTIKKINTDSKLEITVQYTLEKLGWFNVWWELDMIVAPYYDVQKIMKDLKIGKEFYDATQEEMDLVMVEYFKRNYNDLSTLGKHTEVLAQK